MKLLLSLGVVALSAASAAAAPGTTSKKPPVKNEVFSLANQGTTFAPAALKAARIQVKRGLFPFP